MYHFVIEMCPVTVRRNYHLKYIEFRKTWKSLYMIMPLMFNFEFLLLLTLLMSAIKLRQNTY